MKSISIGGRTVPALGQGTWNMGEDSRNRRTEADALRLGIDLGMTLIDTAEMYASGGAEEVVADAVDGRRDDVFLVSKVLPSNASRQAVLAACERSLRRLRTDHIDLYLLHWRGHVPLAETVEALERLRQAGKIGGWGVSNFDTDDMEELENLTGGEGCLTNQILYNLQRRGPEFDLLPWHATRRMPVMAYSPVEQGALAASGKLARFAEALGASPAQVALVWAIRSGNVIAIPKAVEPRHVRENRAAADLALSANDLAALDRLFLPPARKRPLELL